MPSPSLPLRWSDVDARRFRAASLVRDLAGAVGRAVVDDEDLEPRILCEDGGHEAWKVVALVVRRDDDERAVKTQRQVAALDMRGNER